MTEPAHFLNAPFGQPGSGRVRYGAAMELFLQGRISAEVLEIYRAASAHDARNPLTILRERGLPMPEMPMPTSLLTTLYAEARDYLLTLAHPGAAEVRAGLPADPGPARKMPARANALVEEWLQPALQIVARDRPALAAAISGATPELEWITYDLYPPKEIGEAFANGHAYASIMGGDAPFSARDFDLGLFLIAPNMLYRDHHHAAPELYAPLTGPHGWRFGVGRPLQILPAHQPVWNPPHLPHLIKVGALPFLCLFVWTRDVSQPAHVISADDWAALKEMPIG